MSGHAPGLVGEGGEPLREEAHPLGLQKASQVGHVRLGVGHLGVELHPEGEELQELLVLLQKGDDLRRAHQEDLGLEGGGLEPGAPHLGPGGEGLDLPVARLRLSRG